MNFNQIVLEAMEEKRWVLFLKEKYDKDYTSVKTAYLLKPLSWLTDEEKDAIKNKMTPSHSYMNAKEGMDVLGWSVVTVIFDSKKALDKEVKEFKSVFGSAKEEYPLDPELKPHWGGIIDDL